MKSDIVLAGVGGQGILTIAAILGQVAVAEGIHVKQSEIHGMSQRGGSVFSHLRLSTDPIWADQITAGTADILVAMEPMEAMRYRQMLSPDGVLITNASPVKNIPDYPQGEALIAQIKGIANAKVIDADAIAKKLNNPRSVNIVLLGAISKYVRLIESEILEKAIAARFASKGEAVVSANLEAYHAGRQA